MICGLPAEQFAGATIHDRIESRRTAATGIWLIPAGAARAFSDLLPMMLLVLTDELLRCQMCNCAPGCPARNRTSVRSISFAAGAAQHRHQ